jgi:hypothetical protein
MSLSCVSYVGPSKSYTYEENVIAQLGYGTHLERILGLEALEELGGSANASNESMEYVSLITKCKLLISHVFPDTRGLAVGTSQTQKRMLSTKPTVSFRSANELRTEMMERYAKNNYYFLAEYIDCMMERSCSVTFG